MILLMLGKINKVSSLVNNYKRKHRSFRKEKQNISQKRFHSHYYLQYFHRSIDDWEVTLFEKYETQKQLRERETVWEHKFKTFYPLGLNEKGEYLF